MKKQVVYVSEQGSALRVVHQFDRTYVLRPGQHFPWPKDRFVYTGKAKRTLLFGLCSSEDRDLVTMNPKFVTCKRCLRRMKS